MAAGWTRVRRYARLTVAAMAMLSAAALLYLAKADPIPHDASARVAPVDFWKALARPVASRRPSDIVVYPPRKGVQLVTCIGHADGPDKGAWKFLYISTPAGRLPVETRLTEMHVAFSSPWQDAAWVGTAPWVALAFAAVLMAWPVALGVAKMLGEATEKGSTPEPISSQPPQPTAADLQHLRQLEEEMERGLMRDSASQTEVLAPVMTPAAPAATGPMKLTGGPLEQVQKATEESKDYHGEFYPVSHPKEHGFSIVELMIVIGIIGVLAGLLLPSLTAARRDAKSIACEANLHSIAQGLKVYENEYNGCVPASYSYTGQTIVNGVQSFSSQGYTHWSYFLYNSGSTPLGAFLCPELEQGGLPPTNTTTGNLLPGQVVAVPDVIDQQAIRVAYTLNEALSPRNKFASGFQGATRSYQFIRAASIPDSSGTILATEWGPKAARIAATAGTFYLYSHRPVHGFVGLDGTLDMFQLKPGIGYRRVTAADLDADPNTTSSSATRLDWVGRNHGSAAGYPDQRKSNFLYVDGHVESKSIYDTLQPFQWGDKFFTLLPNNDLQQPN